MRAAPIPEAMHPPGFDAAGSGRDAIGASSAAGEGLNVRHGTILTLEDINVSFDGFKALTDLTLYIGVGELRCIIGPNGAGIVNGMKSWFTVAFPEYWLFALGALFIVVTLYLPKGVIGLMKRRGDQ